MKSLGLVVKLSSSNIPASRQFYTEVLGFVVDERYTINAGGKFGSESYMQLTLPGIEQGIAIGLYKDIDAPFPKQDPETVPGTAPTFVVADIDAVRDELIGNKVTVSEIISNTSDAGYTDHFAFFQDPDNNTLVIRQNIDK